MMRILIVEDEILVAQDIEQTLQAAGVEVMTAANCDEALALAERVDFSLALLDVRLGFGESGLMVAELLLDRKAIPSLLLTGIPDLPDHVGAFALGVLAKPFTAADLIAAVMVVRAALTGSPGPAQPPGLTLYSQRIGLRRPDIALA